MQVILLCLLLVAIFSPAISPAQESGSLAEPTPQITVVGERMAPDWQLVRARSPDAANILTILPGMELAAAGGVSGNLVDHGWSGERLKIQINGMDIMSSCPGHMDPPTSGIDPGQLAVMKTRPGISTIVTGGDSLGQTISLDANPPQFAEPNSEPLQTAQSAFFYRSNGDAREFSLQASYATASWNLSYFGSSAFANDQRAAWAFKRAGRMQTDTLPGDVIGSSAYQAANNRLVLSWQAPRHLFELALSQQIRPQQQFPNQRMDSVDELSRQISLHYRQELEWGNVDGRLYHQQTSHGMNFGPDKQSTQMQSMPMQSMPMLTSLGSNGGALLFDVPLKLQPSTTPAQTLLFGADWLNVQLDDRWPATSTSMDGMGPEPLININHGQRNRFGLFATFQTRWTPAWTMDIGLRSESVRMNTGAVQGYNRMPMYATDADLFNVRDHARHDRMIDRTAQISYAPDGLQTLSLVYAVQNRAPSLYERYNWSASEMIAIMNNPGGDGNGYVGSLALQPEQAETWRAAWTWNDPARQQWQLSMKPFITRIRQFIDVQRCGPESSENCAADNLVARNRFVLLQYVNQRARLIGLDLSGYYRWDAFRWDAIASFLNAKNPDTGDRLAQMMPPTLKMALAYETGNWHTHLNWQAVAAKNAVSEVRNEVRTAGYVLLGVSASYQRRSWRFDIGVDNLLNRAYALPLGGVYLGQGNTMSLQGAEWGIPLPGPARSVYTGLSLQF